MKQSTRTAPPQLCSPARRRFHHKLLTAAGGVALAGLGGLDTVRAAVGGSVYERDVVSFLQMDGTTVQVLSGAGGMPRGEVVLMTPNGPGAAKQLAGVRFTELRLECGLDLPRSLAESVGAFLNGTDMPRSGSLVIADSTNRERQRLNFSNAVVGQFALPALDASATGKGPMSVDVRLLPESSQWLPGSGASLGFSSKDAVAGRQSLTFRLRIQNLESACASVSRIEPLVARRLPSPSSGMGQARDYAKTPPRVELPNLVIALPEVNAQPFYDWFNDFVVRGMNDQSRERSGVLELLDVRTNAVAATVSFGNLGIFACEPEPPTSDAVGVTGSTAGRMRRTRVEMYCESMSIALGGAAATMAAPMKGAAPPLLKR